MLRLCGIVVNSVGLIVVIDSESYSIVIFDREWKFVCKLGCYGSVGKIKLVSVIYLNDNDIFVVDESNYWIY